MTMYESVVDLVLIEYLRSMPVDSAVNSARLMQAFVRNIFRVCVLLAFVT